MKALKLVAGPILVLVMAATAAGCKLQADYVAQDRETYDALAPIVSRLVAADAVAPAGSRVLDDDKAEDVKGLMRSWEARLQAGERKVADQ